MKPSFFLIQSLSTTFISSACHIEFDHESIIDCIRPYAMSEFHQKNLPKDILIIRVNVCNNFSYATTDIFTATTQHMSVQQTLFSVNSLTSNGMGESVYYPCYVHICVPKMESKKQHLFDGILNDYAESCGMQHDFWSIETSQQQSKSLPIKASFQTLHPSLRMS